MSAKPEGMRYDRMYRFLWLYAAALALFGLALDSPAGIAGGLRTIVLTEDALITDYVLRCERLPWRTSTPRACSLRICCASRLFRAFRRCSFRLSSSTKFP